LAKLFFEVAQLFLGLLATTLLFRRRARWSGDGWRFRAWRLDREKDTADVEVFLEAVRLEEIGEFERADVAAGMTDFLLEIAHDLDQIGQSKAGAMELEPEPFPVKTQGKEYQSFARKIFQ
jgi:hypothetical protein